MRHFSGFPAPFKKFAGIGKQIRQALKPIFSRILGTEEQPHGELAINFSMKERPRPSRSQQNCDQQPRSTTELGVAPTHGTCFRDTRPYQAPETTSTIPHPAVNNIKKGEGNINQATTAAANDKPPQR